MNRYIVSIGMAWMGHSFGRLFSNDWQVWNASSWWCSISALRWLNCIWAMLFVLVIARILTHLHPRYRENSWLLVCKVGELALFPLWWFYIGLFYTDVLSTLAIVLNYSFALEKRRILSAIVSHYDRCLVDL